VFHVKQYGRIEALKPFDVSRETEERLTVFVELLIKWSRTLNLVSRRDLEEIWPRHVADSLQLLPSLGQRSGRVIDLGSGGGFPGLVLAIAADRPFDLIESDQRKAAFLREAARATAAPATVHAARIEAVSLPPAPTITARALAPLNDLLGLAAPLLEPDGVCLFLKGRGATDELTAAAAHWHMRVERVRSRTDPSGSILHISEIRRALPRSA
jgi:16S rRNA (guanine527-N7)-methyltransferase